MPTKANSNRRTLFAAQGRLSLDPNIARRANKWTDTSGAANTKEAAPEAAVAVRTDAGAVADRAPAPPKPKAQRSLADDAAASARRVAEAWNRSHGTAYASALDPADGEQGGARLTSKREGEPAIALRVRHLGEDVTKKLKHGSTSRYELNLLPGRIQAAIDAHAASAGAGSAQAVLVLFSPVPMQTFLRKRLASEPFDARGFRGVWLCSFGEEACPLTQT